MFRKSMFSAMVAVAVGATVMLSGSSYASPRPTTAAPAPADPTATRAPVSEPSLPSTDQRGDKPGTGEPSRTRPATEARPAKPVQGSPRFTG
jgi:hypothetical protein